MEDFRIEDRFTVENSFAVQILVNVGDSRGIGIGAGRITKESREGRCTGRRQSNAYPWLDDGKAVNDALLIRIKPRRVQRMSYRLDQTSGSAMRQLSIGIEGNDK